MIIDVLTIQRELIRRKYLPAASDDGVSGPITKAAIIKFQSDNNLTPDGIAGPLTLAVLLPDKTDITSITMTNMKSAPTWVRTFIATATSQLGVRESGSNRGHAVEQYQRSCKGSKGEPWCMYFVQWCAQRTALLLDVKNPMPAVTGHVMTFWYAAESTQRFSVKYAKPGDILIFSYSGGRGHTGIVVDVKGNVLHTIEGNTNDAGSREGDGVYAKQRKMTLPALRGVVRVMPW